MSLTQDSSVSQPPRLNAPKFPRNLEAKNAHDLPFVIGSNFTTLSRSATAQQSTTLHYRPLAATLGREDWSGFRLQVRIHPFAAGASEMDFLQARNKRLLPAARYWLTAGECGADGLPVGFHLNAQGETGLEGVARALMLTIDYLTIRPFEMTRKGYALPQQNAAMWLSVGLDAQTRRQAAIFRELFNVSYPDNVDLIRRGDHVRSQWLSDIHRNLEFPLPASLWFEISLLLQLSTVETILRDSVLLSEIGAAAVWPAFPHRPLVVCNYFPRPVAAGAVDEDDSDDESALAFADQHENLKSLAVVSFCHLTKQLRICHEGVVAFSQERHYLFELTIERPLDPSSRLLSVSLVLRKEVEAPQFSHASIKSYFRELPQHLPADVESQIQTLLAQSLRSRFYRAEKTLDQLVGKLVKGFRLEGQASSSSDLKQRRFAKFREDFFLCCRDLVDGDLNELWLAIQARAAGADRRAVIALLRYWLDHHAHDDFDSNTTQGALLLASLQAHYRKWQPLQEEPLQPAAAQAAWLRSMADYQGELRYQAGQLRQALVGPMFEGLPFSEVADSTNSMLDWISQLVASDVHAFCSLRLSSAAALRAYRFPSETLLPVLIERYLQPSDPPKNCEQCLLQLAAYFLRLRDEHAFVLLGHTLSQLRRLTVEVAAQLDRMLADFRRQLADHQFAYVPDWSALRRKLELPFLAPSSGRKVIVLHHYALFAQTLAAIRQLQIRFAHPWTE